MAFSMKRYVYIGFIFLCSLLLLSCSSKKKPTYPYPDEEYEIIIEATEDEVISQNEIKYCTSEPPATKISLQEGGVDYQVDATEGQLMVIFNETVSHDKAISIIQSHNATVAAQIPYLQYYLIEVPVGKESVTFSLFQDISEIDFIYPNAIEQWCATAAHILDDYSIGAKHGEQVESMLIGCNPLMNITTYDVSYNGGGVNTNKAVEYVEQILSTLDSDNGAVINMSFGPQLTNREKILWDDHSVTDKDRNSYKRKYINGLKHWIKLTTKYEDKDFVIVKSVGNEGMKELEFIIEDLKNELSYQECKTFEKHFILVSARDDNKKGDYPNDVSAYHKMVTKADISDMTAQDLDWQGTSFSAPRVAGYISTAAEQHNLTVTSVLQHVRTATKKAVDHVLTYELLEEEIKNALSHDVDVEYEYDNNNTKQDLVGDLAGQVIYEPSDNGYFPKSWSWKIRREEVLSVDVLARDAFLDNLNIRVLAHLHRDALKIDAELIMHYVKNGNGYILHSSTVTKLIVPSQTDYSQYVRLEMDYDFMPTLVLRNNSNMTLFVGGDWSANAEPKRFGCIIEPNSSVSIAIGLINSYHIHFAYRK